MRLERVFTGTSGKLCLVVRDSAGAVQVIRYVPAKIREVEAQKLRCIGLRIPAEALRGAPLFRMRLLGVF